METRLGIRAHLDTSGIELENSDDTLALYADDVVLFISNFKSLPALSHFI